MTAQTCLVGILLDIYNPLVPVEGVHAFTNRERWNGRYGAVDLDARQ